MNMTNFANGLLKDVAEAQTYDPVKEALKDIEELLSGYFDDKGNGHFVNELRDELKQLVDYAVHDYVNGAFEPYPENSVWSGLEIQSLIVFRNAKNIDEVYEAIDAEAQNWHSLHCFETGRELPCYCEACQEGRYDEHQDFLFRQSYEG